LRTQQEQKNHWFLSFQQPCQGDGFRVEDVKLFFRVANPRETKKTKPSLNAIAAESKVPPEKQNSAIRWIAIFNYFPKRTSEEPPVVVL